MLSWLAKRTIARNMAGASAGELGPTLRMDAEDVGFHLASTGDPLSRRAIGGAS